MYSKNSGFTLIEILVSVGIISILAGVIYASFGSARDDAKNKSFQTEIKEMQLSIELYKAQNGEYPDVPTGTLPPGCVTTGTGVETSNSSNCGTIEYITGLVPDFIAELPDEDESANPGCTVTYAVESPNRSWYKLTAANCYSGATVPSEGIQQDEGLARCPTTCPATGSCDPSDASFYESFAVYSSGGECQ